MLRLLAASLVVLLAAPASADVLTVGAGGYATIQAAVDAAADGDTIVVQPGAYPGFTVEAKGLTIVAEDGVANTGAIVVRGIGLDQTVLMQNLDAQADALLGAPPSAHLGLLVEECAGFVRFADCAFRGDFTFSCVPLFGSTFCVPLGHGALLRSKRDVAFVRCVFVGKSAPWWSDGSCLCSPGFAGGTGLQDEGGTTVLQHCDLRGGSTGGSEGWGNWGGHGYRGGATMLYAEGNVLRGGSGGSSETSGQGGPGGHGLWYAAHAQARATLRHNDALGGAGGIVYFDPWYPPPYRPGPNGVPYQLDGLATTYTSPLTRLDVESPVRVDELTTVEFSGEPGTLLFTAVSLADGSLSAPQYEGWLCIGAPIDISFTGVIPASGTLLGEVLAPDTGAEVLSLRVQAFATTDLVHATLTNWTPVVVLAPDA